MFLESISTFILVQGAPFVCGPTPSAEPLEFLEQVEDHTQSQLPPVTLTEEEKKRIEDLIVQLKDPSLRVQMQAAETIGEIADKAEAAVPALIEALKPRTEGSVVYFGVSQLAAKALGKMGVQAKVAVPALKELLDGGSRAQAAVALWRIGERAESNFPKLIPGLIEALKDGAPDVRTDAAAALQTIVEHTEAAVPALIAAMRHSNPEVSLYAIRALGTMGAKAEAAVPALVESLDAWNALVVRAAAKALGQMGVKAKVAVSALKELLDGGSRAQAAVALWRIGERAESNFPKLIPGLLEALTDDDPDVRTDAAAALQTTLEHAEAAVPELIRARLGDNPQVSKVAIEAIVKMAERAVPELMKALKDQDADIRCIAAQALGRIGEKAAAAVAALTERLGDENVDVRASVVSTLMKIGELAVPPLIEALKDRAVRSDAALLLGWFGEKAAAAKPALLEELLKTHDSSNFYLARALIKIEAKGKGPSPEVIEAVVKVLKSQESWAQQELFNDLAAVGQHAGPVLISLMKDSDDFISFQASRALETSSPEVIPLLSQELITGGLNQLHEKQLRFIVKGLVEKFGSGPVLDVLLRDFSSSDINHKRSVLYLMGLGGFELSAAGDAEMRQKYGDFLSRLHPNLNRVRAVLDAGLQNPDLRWNAIWALGEMGGVSAWAVPSMVRIYSNSRFHNEKIRVIEAWGKMGRSAQGARDLLLREARLAGGDSARIAALRSLGQIVRANDAEVIDVLTQIASQPGTQNLAGAATQALDSIESQNTSP